MRIIAARLLATTCLIAVAGVAHAQQGTAASTAGDTGSSSAPVATEAQPSAVTPTAASAAVSGSPTADSGQLGDIVVTANRVETVAQKTPISLTAYTGKSLIAAGVTNVQALQTIDPSVSVTSSTGAAYVAIRGIASTDVTEIGDPSVPIARDGFFTNRSFSIGTSFYDVERVEVLKGPQGTLFGRNSTGGLINIITRKPGLTAGGYATMEIGTYGTGRAEAALNLPVSDKLQFRFSGFASTHRGYRDLINVPRGDDDLSASGRVEMAFEPFDGFKGLITYQHDHIDDVGDVAEQGQISTVPAADQPDKTFPNYEPTSTRIEGDRVRWEFSYDRLPLDATLTYAGGYDNQHWNHETDASTFGGAQKQQFIQSERPKTWNHEVRIALPQNNPFTAQVGYFHFDENNTVNSGLLLRSGAFAENYLIKFNYGIKTQSDAVFGQAAYRLGEQFRISAGARYTWDKKDRVGTAQLRCDVAGIPPFVWPFIGCDGTPPILTTPGNGSIRQSKPTFHAGLDWTPTNRNLIYAKFDTGYKSGGFNSNGSAPSVDYGPENLDAWEVGTKNRFFDNKLQLNAAAFYQKYRGYQASQTTAVISSGNGVFNIGSAKIYGVEASAIALFGKTRLDVNGTWLHANFDNDVGQVADGNGVARNVAGKRLPNAPRFVISAGIEHPFPIGDATITPRIDGKFSTKLYYSVFNDPDTEQRHYATGNASITFAPNSGKYQLAAFVRNFTDEAVYANAARNFVAFINTYEFQPPRVFGVRGSVNF